MAPPAPLPEPARPHFRLVLSVLFVCALFLVLAALYGQRFPRMATQYDVWFRTDVNHYLQWIKFPGFIHRFPLHPATLVILKPYGFLVGRFLAVDARFLPLFSLPVIVFHAITLTGAAYRWDAQRFPVIIALALLVGPLLLLAPVPESHTLGGLSLLMTAVCVRRRQSAEHYGNEGDTRRWTGHAFAWGLIATGFSLSNLVPAVLVAVPLRRAFRPSKRQWFALAAMGASILVLGGLQFLNRYRQESVPVDFATFVLSRFQRWLLLPDGTAILRSLRALVMAPFGVPETSVFAYTSEAGVPYAGVILRDAPNVLQIAAAAGWMIGIARTYARGSDREERFFIARCAFALLWLVVFHSFFAADEAFMFAVHAWPFLFLPGLLALRQGLATRDPLTLVSLGLAILLSAVRTLVGLPALFRLPL
ncbi:MAG: hypothetical protein SFU56_16590 [Capsulimonadales bacterium]|nr:hypothetical protein [Capsulimonadales bacterium]